MLKPVIRDNKKPYSSPIITVYGTVQELTQKIGDEEATTTEDDFRA